MRQSWKEQMIERASLSVLPFERREALVVNAIEAGGSGRASSWPGGHSIRKGEPSSGL
jgi:hypothetical protein